MWQALVIVAAIGACSAGCAPLAQAAPAKTGVAGQVRQSPAAPGPTRIGQENGTAPVAAVTVQLRDSKDAVVASATTDADGGFTLEAPAGSYDMHVDVQGMYPRCQGAPVKIRKGRMARLDIGCDSGMR
jgi:hypothetical protein